MAGTTLSAMRFLGLVAAPAIPASARRPASRGAGMPSARRPARARPAAGRPAPRTAARRLAANPDPARPRHTQPGRPSRQRPARQPSLRPRPGRGSVGPRPGQRSPAQRRPGPQRPTRAPRRRVHPLQWLGFAEVPVHLEGHPRIRERALETLHQQRRRSRLATASLGIILAVGLLTAGLLRSPLLGIEAVTVVGLDDERQQVVSAASRVAPGTNVLDVDLEGVETAVEGLPWVDTASVTRRLPSTLEIRVAARTPVAVAVHDSGAFLLDGEGIVLGEAIDVPATVTTGTGTRLLPAIDVLQTPVPGTPITDPVAASAAQVAAAMPRALDEWIVSYASSASGEVDATMRIGAAGDAREVVVHLGRPEAIDAKAATIAALLAETRNRGVVPQVLDVRIPDRPVISS